MAIAAAYVAAFLILLFAGFEGGRTVFEHLPSTWRLLPAALLVFAIGLIDDVRGLSPGQKLLGECVAAVCAILGGVRIVSIAGYVPEAWLTVPITVLWLIGCTNAFNLIDGVDGLATGVGLFATTTSLIAALLQHNFELAVATVPLAGALLGFLRYNFNPASIFLGDSGSLTVGFLLGCFSVLWSQKSATMLGMTAPLMALTVPLLDTGLSIVRRFLSRKPIFGADRGHIHHRLLARGFTPLGVALLSYGVCAVASTFSLIASVWKHQYGAVVIVLYCAVAWVGIQRLEYLEFHIAGRLALSGAFRGLLSAHVSLSTFEKHLHQACSADECWGVIHEAYTEFGFRRVAMKLAGRYYSAGPDSEELSNSWSSERTALHHRLRPAGSGNTTKRRRPWWRPLPTVSAPSSA